MSSSHTYSQLFAICLIFAYVNCQTTTNEYKVPTPEIQVFSPKGVRICITDSPNIDLLTLNANINKPIASGANDGQISMIMFESVDGKWVYINRTLEFKTGDKIHYTVFLNKDGVGYGVDGIYHVNRLINDRITTHHYHSCGRNTHVLHPSLQAKHETHHTGAVIEVSRIDSRIKGT